VTNTAYIRSHRPVPGPAPSHRQPPFCKGGVRAQYRARQENAGNDGAREGGNVA
jgi:hypothetical protein